MHRIRVSLLWLLVFCLPLTTVDWTAAAQVANPSGFLTLPFQGSFGISDGFDQHFGRSYGGVDYRTPLNTPILAAADGRVELAGWDSSGYGNLVKINHQNRYVTLYAHLNRVDVETGQTVSRGQRIGMSGNTGRSTGPHLHFEVRRDGKPVDPFGVARTSPHNAYLWTTTPPSSPGTGSVVDPPVVENPGGACNLVPPTLGQPANGSTWPQSHAVTLQWNTGCPSSFVELSGGHYEDSLNFGGWQNRTSVFIGTMWSGTYNWRVKVRNAAGSESGWSSTTTFTIGQATSNPNPPPPPDVGSDGIEIVYVSNRTVRPGERFRPQIRVRVNNGQLRQDRGDMLRCADPNCENDAAIRFGAFPQVAVTGTVNTGQTYTFVFYEDDPMIAPSSTGSYSSNWRIWREGRWVGPKITIDFTVSSPQPPPRNSCGNPTADQVVLYSDTEFGMGSGCVTLGVGDYPNPGQLGSLGNDNAESIRVGANVRAILYQHDQYQGHAETFDGDDRNLWDNGINGNVVSSVRVERRPQPSPVPTSVPTLRAPRSFQQAGELGCDRVQLAWEPYWTTSRHADGLRIYRDGAQVAELSTGVSTYVNTGLNPATSYTFHATAFSGQLESEPSHLATVTTPECPAPATEDPVVEAPPAPPGEPSDPSGYSFLVDMGSPGSEAEFALQGWGGTQDAPENPLTSSSGDTSKRFQLIGGDNSIVFTPVVPGAAYLLIAEVEDGGCDDSFQLLVNGVVVDEYTATEGTDAVHVHRVEAPGDIVTSERLVVTFRNVATDDCGAAAVYSVALDGMVGIDDPPQTGSSITTSDTPGAGLPVPTETSQTTDLPPVIEQILEPAGSTELPSLPPATETTSEAPVPEIETNAPPKTGSGTIAGTDGEGVRCRQDPSEDAAILTVIPEGSVVELVGEPIGDWQPVNCNGQSGYVFSVYVQAGELSVTGTDEQVHSIDPIDTGESLSENAPLNPLEETTVEQIIVPIEPVDVAPAPASTVEAPVVPSEPLEIETQVQEPQSVEDPVVEPLVETPVLADDPPPDRFYVDLGVEESEAAFQFQGWGGFQDESENPLGAPSGDRSKRYQLLQADNSLILTPVAPGATYTLTTEVEDGGCDDSFQLVVNGVEFLQYSAQPGSDEVRVHQIEIPGSAVTSDVLEVTFRNVALDDCGTAAVYNVELELISGVSNQSQTDPSIATNDAFVVEALPETVDSNLTDVQVEQQSIPEPDQVESQPPIELLPEPTQEIIVD